MTAVKPARADELTFFAMKQIGHGLVERGRFADAEKLFEGLAVVEPDDAYIRNALSILRRERSGPVRTVAAGRKPPKSHPATRMLKPRR